MINIILILLSLAFGIVWNHYILKITPKKTTSQIIGIATYGTTTIKLKASENIPMGHPVMVNSEGLVKKATNWEIET